MDYQNRHVVITGGTGALGVAVVGALLAAGAVCHVPYRNEEEAKRFPHRENRDVSLVALGDLADKSAVTALYAGLDELWASVHIAGGFAFAPISLVNAVAPSTLDTPANRASRPKAQFNAWPKVEEVAATVLFLASPQNRVTRGAIVPTYGKA